MASCSKNKYDDIQVKYGYYKDDELVKKSASGGASSVFAETILSENNGRSEVAIYGVVYSDDFKSARFQRASSYSDLDAFKGSKYIKADMKMANGEYVFGCIENDLCEGRVVLFTGLGCEVGALKKYLETHDVDDSNLYTVDLICHGPTLAVVQEDYVTALEKKFRSKITSFSVRYKKRGWKPPYVHAVFLNGKVYDKPLYETELGYAFNTYLRESCYSCNFKGANHPADLTIGDYGGVVPGMPAYNKNGVSIIFARTEKGKELLSRVDTSSFIIGDVDLDFALQNNKMFETSYAKAAYRDMFIKDFKEKGLHYACVHSPGYKQYTKVAIKKMIKRGLNL